MVDLQLLPLDRPALVDTGTWTWVRDRRFPELASWFNAAVEAGLVLVCDLVIPATSELPRRVRFVISGSAGRSFGLGSGASGTQSP